MTEIGDESLFKRATAHFEVTFFAISSVLLAVGGVVYLFGEQSTGELIWAISTILGLLVALIVTANALVRKRFTVDVIALLALAGSLWVGEMLAGAIVVVMLASGELLEARAASRAQRELSLLVSRAPRRARRCTGDVVEDIDISQVAQGDQLIVGSGEVIPVDGRLLCDGTFDESALSGEAIPVGRVAGDDIRSGVVNAGRPVDLIATATAEESTYADIVRMVEQAQAASAPFVRTADKFAVAFVPITLLLAGAAWVFSGDEVRAVAVLVVATPCPLLLAAPIAIMSGLSRCSRAGVVVKGGAVLEALAGGRTILFDKTGTLTAGRPTVQEVIVADDRLRADELLRLSASLDQISPHVLASAIVSHARARGMGLSLPNAVHEVAGYGLEGTVDGRLVRVGKASWIVGDRAPLWARQVRRRASLDGSLTVFVAVDGEPAGAFVLEDQIRPDAPRMMRQLKSAGIRRTVLVTGDRPDVAEIVARVVGIDSVHADRDPGEKVAVINEERQHGPTIMVGDGVNDAPALATADVGVALASRGASASSETADVVLTVDRVGALASAIIIARRSQQIALQAVVIGMGLSGLAMVAAALGYLPPAVGALLQEVIDVLAMGWALRAMTSGPQSAPEVSAADSALIERIEADHNQVRSVVEEVRSVADTLSEADPSLVALNGLLTRLEDELVPHEREEEQLLYPVVARILGGTDPMGAMSRSHAEIEHQINRLRRLVDDIGDQSVDADDIVELRRLLYGLYAVLRLHNAQEEEGAFSLLEASVNT
ncbi:MAG: heavy metal translocating P-type ATPase [Candidatus Nanopelagicales bacterium]